MFYQFHNILFLMFNFIFFYVAGFVSLLIACCVTHLYVSFNIELSVEECDATKVQFIFQSRVHKNFLIHFKN